ncbi:type IV toxin-antitoxin system AbiEi family antitoxin domain-containing protein [Arthrobacter sp. NEB 688]|uniref:type IV toxin-antitoxin system AbiEi family antitoxin domain-containing protein n=1 Tax=Arthrobacter sp. NEB 688 TaxID=904039 RepID=UPI001565F29C|nr:type IV toxin-antitoxin system AbiEi family antitoxin domain-containing protein [Arthrobacter sp. NEB 688]QKE83976.1 type IV toxin-antitoxin system AbiEi family antitoxin domain-containing protein [Arthrobacter sp. NEB 688]
MDGRLTAFALARGGVFTSAEAISLGVEETALRRARASGAVVRVRRDAYVLGGCWEDAVPEQRLALRTRAVLRTRGTDVASHQSALALHGLPLVDLPLDVVDVLGASRRTRSAGGLRIHPRDGASHVVADGYRCVPVAHALAQVVVRSGVQAGLVPVDAALHAGRVSREELGAALAAVARRPAQQLRAESVTARCSALSESPGETLARLFLVDAGFEVRAQVPVTDEDGLVGRVDLLVEGRVVVEFDGALKYGGAQGREALVAEKRREDRLRAVGYAVVRVTWADLAHPERVVARVRRALAGLSASGVATAVS